MISSRGYVFDKIPGHPLAQATGIVLEHRRIWYEKHGAIPEGCVIHHKNENRKDNRLSNLECLTRIEHSRLHHLHGFGEGQGPKEYITVKCVVCKKKFKRNKAREAWVTKNISKDRLGITCNRKCWSVWVYSLRLKKRELKNV